MKTLAWKEKFNIPSDSEHSIAEILRSGFISEEDYLQWASETYQIPLLDHEFFKTVNNYRLVLDNPSPLWSETFFPILEWENTLFVVCLEPQEIELSKPHTFVLASLFRMETIWNKMEKTALPDESIDPTLVIPNAVPSQDEYRDTNSHIQDILTTPDFSFNNILGSENESPAPQAAPEPEDVPTPPAPQEIPDSPPVVTYKSPSENIYEDSKITSLFTQTENTQISIPDFIIDELMKPEPVQPKAPPQEYLGPEDTQVVQLGKTKPEITFTNTKTIMPFPERSTHFSFIRTVFSEQIILEARDKIKENTDPHQALISAFHIMKDYYKKLLWAVRDQKGAVYAIASNSAWDFSEEAWNTPLDFKSPNPFRIAKFTAKPFHGEVYPNPINDQFFKLWNNGKYPPVFTIVPIRLQGKVFAYFIGCEPALHYHPINSLDIMTATCDELVQTFLAIHKELTPPTSKAS